jgi:anti-sigma factor RsiW
MSNTTEKPICAQANELVNCLYGEANAAEAAAFARHMDGCSECRTEFALMANVRESVSQWRSEVLGLGWRTEPVTAADPVGFKPVTPARHLSALAALRQFFTVSPLWLRGATAVAAVVFCMLAALFMARTLAPREQLYTQGQVDDRVQQEVAKTKNEIRNAPGVPASETAKEQVAGGTQPPALAPAFVAIHPRPKAAKAGHGSLSREEREQLASDLRLKPTDDEDLTFLFEGGSD